MTVRETLNAIEKEIQAHQAAARRLKKIKERLLEAARQQGESCRDKKTAA